MVRINRVYLHRFQATHSYMAVQKIYKKVQERIGTAYLAVVIAITAQTNTHLLNIDMNRSLNENNRTKQQKQQYL